MTIREHHWAEFFSPRNGMLSIQACHNCGVAKSVGTKKISCRPVSTKKKNSRLRGWTTKKTESAYRLGSLRL